jgi:hypothetical protein
MGNHGTHQGDASRAAEPLLVQDVMVPAVLPDGDGGFTPCPELLTEDELIRYLRIREVSNGGDPHNVVENLKRMHDLTCIHVCKKPLYPVEAVRRWIEEKVRQEQRR